MATLEQIIVIHRHGARFPMKSLRYDLSWPINHQFWSSYRGQLTPIGVFQMIDVGRDIRKYYQKFMQDVPDTSIRVHTSNSQRTMMSAWSFLMGAFPEKRAYYKYMSDRRITSSNVNISGQIPILVETQIKTDKMFHVCHGCKKPELLESNMASSRILKEAAMDPSYHVLCDKLYNITGMMVFSPENDIMNKFRKFRCLHSQLRIANAHHLMPFPEDHGLTDQELNMIDVIGDEVKRCATIPGDYSINPDKRTLCRNYLLNEIYRYIVENKYHFIEMSAHDTTLFEFASTLGVSIPTPEFASYFLFEKWSDSTIRVYYNPDPTTYLRENLVPRKWEISDKYQCWTDLSEGGFDIHEFGVQFDLIKYLDIYERAFSGLWNLRTSGDFDFDTCTEQDIIDKYPMIAELFCYIDDDNDGKIQLDEYLALYDRLGHVESYSSLAETFEKYGNDGVIDLHCFLRLLMRDRKILVE